MRLVDPEGKAVARGLARRVMPLVVLAALLVAGCQRDAASRATPPDVVLIVVDALRADRVREALRGRGGLPTFARLAQDAVVYERAASPATWCVPGYASLLTGLWPSFHGAERRVHDGETQVLPLDAEVRTLAELLRARGLRTGAFLPGRPDLSPEVGFDRGFEDFVDDPRLADPRSMAQAIARWLNARSGPVFLFVSLDGLRRAREEDGALVPRAEITTVAAREGGLTPERQAKLNAGYDASLDEVDAAVREILAVLQADGRYAGALIVVTADHGELLGEQGLAGHGWPPFEGMLSVPLIVKYPEGRDAGERVEHRVSTIGVFATILEETGVALPDGVKARPLDQRHPVWAEDVDRKGRRVRAGYDGLRHKLIRIQEGEVDVACLYDMYKDWGERHPDCSQSNDSPLHRAMASFASQPRFGEPESGLARANGRAAPPRAERAHATN